MTLQESAERLAATGIHWDTTSTGILCTREADHRPESAERFATTWFHRDTTSTGILCTRRVDH